MAPKPVSKTVVCSECGQPWDAHIANGPAAYRAKYKPTAEDCVRVLKAALAAAPKVNYGYSIATPSGSSKFFGNWTTQ